MRPPDPQDPESHRLAADARREANWKRWRPYLAARQVPLALLLLLLLLLREWHLHPNGQIPAYDYELSSVNPPVHAWACWEVYLRSGREDIDFLKRVFPKLLLNFTWWVNRKDAAGRGLFRGGFLGLDNIGVFDRSKPLPGGGTLEQADGTAWMGFYCTCMLSMAVELARHDPSYEDMASKFFEHFLQIAEALNALGGQGLWHEGDGFYYDRVKKPGEACVPLRVRSLVGLVPLLAVYCVREEVAHALPGFESRMLWFFENRKPELARLSCLEESGEPGRRRILLALASRDQLRRTLARVLDEAEFLAPHGVRSLSKYHLGHPFVYDTGLPGHRPRVGYVPGDMDSFDFGGNSNWPGLVPAQLPAGAGTPRVPPLLRRRLPNRVPDGVGAADEPGRGGGRTRKAAGVAALAGCQWRAAVPRPGLPPRRRPALERLPAVPRVLRRRHRAWPGGQSPGVDRARGRTAPPRRRLTIPDSRRSLR